MSPRACIPGAAAQGTGWLHLALPLLLLQLALTCYLELGRLGLATYLGAHLALCGAAALAGAAWAMAGPRDVRADRVVMTASLAAWTALAGPFGTLIAGMLHAAPAAGGVVAPIVPPTAAGRLERLESALLDHRLRLDGADAIRPLLDVMREGSQAEKLDALSLIARRYEADAAPALRRGLVDPDSAVRVLAATVAAQCNSACTRRIGECLTRAQARPDRAEEWQALAEAHVAYARSGLLEATRADAELAQADRFRARAAGLAGEPHGAEPHGAEPQGAEA